VMLSGLIVTALFMFAILIVAFIYIDSKNKNKKKQLRLDQVEQANNVRSRYKVDIARLAEELALTPDTRSKLLMIGNNFFVYQAMNELAISNLTFSLDKISNLLSKLQEDFNSHGEESSAIDKIDSFIGALPQSARGFNSAFYNGNLSVVCQLLSITESDNEEQQETESDDDNDSSDNQLL